MRAAVYHGREDLRLEDVPDPEPGTGEVKLEIQYAGICGTDLNELYGGPTYTSVEPHPVSGVALPVILGHELSGIVTEVGAGVTGVAPGDLVCIDPIDACFTCERCAAGRAVFCADVSVHGYTRNGGALAEFTTVTEPMVHRIPEGVTPLQAALVEPMTVGRRAAKRTRTRPGDTAAVHGAGPIGLAAGFALRSAGVDCIFVDPAHARQDVARALGFEVLDSSEADVVATILDLTGGAGVAASVDAAGVPAALRAAFASTAIDGTVVLVAVPSGQAIEVPTRLFRRGEVWFTASSGGTREDFGETIAAMAEGVYPTDHWVETIPFDDILAGFEGLRRGEKTKVLVDIAGRT